MDIKVSVIIPLYNCAAYIERCANSLFSQTFNDAIEFVFVNDGSTDSSVEVLKNVLRQYPERKNQFVLVDRSQNMGVAYTRREGVHIARGEYICWCDSDDWVDLDTYEKMYCATQNGFIDIVVCNYIEEYADHRNYWKYKEYQTPQQALADFYWLGFPFSLCTKMTRRSLMTEALDFITPTNYGEDSFASIFLFLKSSSVKYLSDAFYHYDRTNEVSIMHSISMSRELWLQQKDNLDRLVEICRPRKTYSQFFQVYKQGKKREFRYSFPNIWRYYWTYRECALSLDQYRDYLGLKKVYVWLVNNFFPLYWLYNRKTWNEVQNINNSSLL